MVDGVLCQDCQVREGFELFHEPKGRNRNIESKGFNSILGKAFQKSRLY